MPETSLGLIRKVIEAKAILAEKRLDRLIAYFEKREMNR